jgi:hypothetical protein
MRPVRLIAAFVLAATAGTLAVSAAPAAAASTSTAAVVVQARPNPVVAGQSVTLSGSVGPEAAASDCDALILYSQAFTPTDDPTAAPVYTTAKPSGAFTVTAKIPRARAAGTFPIHLRCGGSTVGGGTLVVQEAHSTLQVSPRSVVVGDRVTVSGWLPLAPGSECATGVTLLSRAFGGSQEFAGVPAIVAAVKADGTFTVVTRIPSARAAGTYTISGRCGGGNIGASAALVVRAAPAPTTKPAVAPPAPSVTEPQAPTPTAEPAPTPVASVSTPASQLGSRWVIPGLAAVGASTLAALGMWLLYRRQHRPASAARNGLAS